MTSQLFAIKRLDSCRKFCRKCLLPHWYSHMDEQMTRFYSLLLQKLSYSVPVMYHISSKQKKICIFHPLFTLNVLYLNLTCLTVIQKILLWKKQLIQEQLRINWLSAVSMSMIIWIQLSTCWKSDIRHFNLDHHLVILPFMTCLHVQI